VSDKKIIAVTGATGAQGGGLVRAILNDPDSQFRVRALTRDVNSDKAKELVRLGAEVVAADLDDEASLEKAFEGAYGAFCVTFFWHHFSAEQEVAQATAMANAAKKANLKHVIWSSLEDTRRLLPIEDPRMPVLQEKYNVPHFDGKGEADNEFRKLGLPLTVLLTSFYWDNFIHFGLGPKRGADGNLAITFPMGSSKLPGIAAEDIGKCAYGIFKKGGEYIGRTVGIAGGHLTGTQMAEAFSKTLGQAIRYNAVEPDLYRSFGFPGADEMGNMFQFKRDFEKQFCGARDLNTARSLNPELLTFHAWLEQNKELIPLE
jgi:uncharacterized protein YbjT (DUF2867 family)